MKAAGRARKSGRRSIRHFESVVNATLAQLLDSPLKQIDAAIEDVHRLLCRDFEFDRATLWQRSSSTSNALLLTHFCQPASPLRLPNPADAIPLADSDKVRQAEITAEQLFPWTVARLNRGELTVVSRLQDLPSGAARDRETFGRYHTRSTIVVPLHMGPEILGALTCASVNAQRRCPRELLHQVQFVGQLLAQSLVRQSLESTQREARLQAILDTVTEGILTLNAAGFIESANLGAERTFGYGAGELIGCPIALLMPQAFPPPDLSTAPRPPSRRTATTHPAREVNGQRKDGTIFRLRLALRPLLPGNRRLVVVGPPHETPWEVNSLGRESLTGQLIQAQEQERASWARELHDDITQRLARMAIDLSRFEYDAPRDLPDTGLVRGVREELVRLCEDTHALSHQLHPATLMDLGLDEALRAECEQLSHRHPVAAALTTQNLPPLIDRDTTVNLFRIAQESMRNAVQHGGASRIDVNLRGIGAGLQLAVQDNGTGFLVSRRRKHVGLGLASMRERARLLRGSIEILSKPGHGTTVIARVPLRSPTHDHSTPYPARGRPSNRA